MSRLRGRVYATPRTTKALIIIIFSLIVVGSVFSLLTFPRALAATIVSDNFKTIHSTQPSGALACSAASPTRAWA